MEALPIHDNQTYTEYLSNPKLDLEGDCRYLCSMVEVILSSEYPFFNKVTLIKLSSSESFAR